MPKNDMIFQRLSLATGLELVEICKTLGLDAKYKNDFEKISSEFRSVSGHTVANAFRDAHALEYKSILWDTYHGIKFFSGKELRDDYLSKDFNMDEVTCEELENEIRILSRNIYQNLKKQNDISYEDFTKKIKGCGKYASNTEIIVGGGGLGLFARLISLPVAAAVTTAQIFSTPTYRKTFIVVIQLIQIKNRVEVEQKLKEMQ